MSLAEYALLNDSAHQISALKCHALVGHFLVFIIYEQQFGLPAWPGGMGRGLAQRRSRVQTPKPRHSFLSPLSNFPST